MPMYNVISLQNTERAGPTASFLLSLGSYIVMTMKTTKKEIELYLVYQAAQEV